MTSIVLHQIELACTLLLLCCSFAWAEERPKRPRELSYPELKFSLPEVERVVLENGLVVYLRENHSLPIVDFYAVTRVGAVYDPPEKSGLANMTAMVMRTSGTKDKTGDEIDEILEFVGASIQTDIEMERGTVRISCMSGDVDTILPLFAEILVHAQFREEKIDLARKELMESIRRRDDDPFGMVQREFARLIYGEHPYGQPIEGEAESVSRIEREDLLAFHERYYAPNNTLLGVSGDFDGDQMLDRLRQVFGKWSRRDVALPEIPPLPEENAPPGGVYYYAKDLTESHLALGHLGIRRTDEDYIPVQITDFILGGGAFTSRLSTKMRSGEGLAYTVFSRFVPHRDRGLFLTSASTKAEATIRAITLMKNEIQRICDNLVAEDELRTAKDSYLNRFVFNFTTARTIVQRRVDSEYDGLPLNYLDTYCEKVAQVTREDILKVARKWLHPESLRILVVGDKTRFDGSLEQFGPVEVLEVRDHAGEVDAALRR